MEKKSNNAEYSEPPTNQKTITFWFGDDVSKLWNHRNSDYRRGRPRVYSDSAIESLLIIRKFFRLTYRSAAEFGQNIFTLLGIQDARVPDYTSLCKRAKKLDVAHKLSDKSGPLHIMVDGASLKVYDEDEWNALREGKGKSKSRTWRKLYVARNPKTHKIAASRRAPVSASDSLPKDA